MKECPKRYCLYNAIAVFLFMFIYEKVLHHNLLRGMYHQTAGLWRSKEEMIHLMPWVLVRYALLALLISCVYGKIKSAMCSTSAKAESFCPNKFGLGFGLKLGVFMALLQSCMYLHMPVPLEMETALFLAYIVEGIGIGMVLGALCGLLKRE